MKMNLSQTIKQLQQIYHASGEQRDEINLVVLIPENKTFGHETKEVKVTAVLPVIDPLTNTVLLLASKIETPK